jgi:hypothetical protein
MLETWYIRFLLWYYRVILKANRLDALDMVELGCPLAKVISLYEAPPKASEPLEEFPEATRHEFHAGPYHLLGVVEWRERIVSVTYESLFPEPNRDLRCALVAYGEGIGWREIERGYLCIRKDEEVRLWCSAFPVITVENEEFFRAKVRYIQSQRRDESDID